MLDLDVSNRELEMNRIKEMRWRAPLVILTLLLGLTTLPSTEVFGGRLESDTLSAMQYPGSRDRQYQVYIPNSYTGDEPVPMVMVLHGCKQTQSNMVQETRFRELADSQGFIVVYPFITSYPSAESRNLNCWGFWFDQHIHEGAGEAEDLYQIALAVESRFSIDPNRRYVAGLSSGGAMSVVMAVAQSEYFAAAGAVAGLPYSETASSVGFVCANPGVFRPIDEVVAAMDSEQSSSEEQQMIPMMVIHSLNDCTVNKKASEMIRDSWVRRYETDSTAYETDDCTREGVSCVHKKYGVAGRSTVETVFYQGESGGLTGAGSHYWVGDNDGEFANPDGPSASELLWAFFVQHPRDDETCPDGNNAPRIALRGDPRIDLRVGEPFVDPGATASDAEDGDLSESIVVTGSVDTNTRGTYRISYNVSDSQGCPAPETTRRVIVSDCQEWTETNAEHAAAGRATGCWFWFYCAQGSGDYLGFWGGTTTTVRNEDPNEAFYSRGACPP
jgi:poly(hydroxyalkanoate) depolymerase family esterase